VLASRKPEIKKVVLLQLERLLFYAKEHPDVIDLFALNAALIDEEKIELHNASLGRDVKPRQKYELSTYKKASCQIIALRTLEASLDKLTLRRSAAKSEDEKLRELYATTSWQKTNLKIDDWIFDRFFCAINGDADRDARWPRDPAGHQLEQARKNLPKDQ